MIKILELGCGMGFKSVVFMDENAERPRMGSKRLLKLIPQPDFRIAKNR